MSSTLSLPPIFVDLVPEHKLLGHCLPISCIMEEMKNDAIEILSDDSSVEGKTDFLANEEPDIATSTESCAQHPFQKWMESFRANRRVPQTVREREVIGWYENDRLDLVSLAQNDQLLEARRNSTASDRSSQLGTVRTWSLAVTSVSCGASRGRAQSNAGLSMVSSTRNSAESSRPTSNPGVDENAAETRATDRRRILRELLTTEVDYVIGLKALIQVNFTLCILYGSFRLRVFRSSLSSSSDPNYLNALRRFVSSMRDFCASCKQSRQCLHLNRTSRPVWRPEGLPNASAVSTSRL